MADWRDHLIEDPVQARAIARAARRVAVLGIKPESRRHEPAHYVPAYLVDAGIEVVPVPVYYPNVTEILGQPVVRNLRAVPRPVDVVDVFRRAEDIPEHLDDLLALRPDTVWLQSGIRHDEVAEKLARAGIHVVSDRCLMVEHQRGQAWG